MRRYYPAVIDRDGDVYGISFPDFLGCVSSGATPEEAIEGGREALSGHVDLMIRDGDVIPNPTPLNAIPQEADEDVVCTTLIPVELPGRAVRVNISLDEGLLAEIDGIAGRGRRSAFLADAAKAEIARRSPHRAS